MKPSLMALLSALFFVCLTACGGTESGTTDVPQDEPCGGACPADQCVFGMCVGEANNDTNNAPDADLPDVEEPDADEPDADEPDADEPDADEPDVDEPDAEEEGCRGDGDCEDPTTYCAIEEGQQRGMCLEGCRDDDGCEGNDICQDNVCVSGCRDDDGCPLGRICLEAQCVQGCREDDACRRGEICQDNVCVDGCRDDEGCGRREICVDDLCVEGCRDNGNCRDGSYCETVLLSCQPGCDTGNQCPSGFCDRFTNTCECFEDEQCPNSQRCAGQRCVPVCNNDTQCEDGQFCDPFLGVCADDCIEDDSEPNNSANQNALLLFDRGQLGRIEGRRLCGDNEDWYRIQVQQPGDTVAATLRQDPQDPSLRLEILDPQGDAVLATAAPEGGQLAARTAPLGQAGFYLVRVSTDGALEPSGVSYELSAIATGIVSCSLDAFESNDTPQDAASIASGDHLSNICPGDTDWLRFELEVGDRVELTLEYDHAVIAPAEQLITTLIGPDSPEDVRDFFVFDDGDTDTMVNNPAGFTVGLEEAGTWQLFVDSTGLAASVDYTVNLTITSPQCADQNEPQPNESCEQATALALGTSQDGFVCGLVGDEDWYSVTVEEGTDVSVLLEHFHFDGNLEMELYEPDGQTLIDFSYNAGPDFEAVELLESAAQSYCVRVFPASVFVQNGYTLSTEVIEQE